MSYELNPPPYYANAPAQYNAQYDSTSQIYSQTVPSKVINLYYILSIASLLGIIMLLITGGIMLKDFKDTVDAIAYPYTEPGYPNPYYVIFGAVVGYYVLFWIFGISAALYAFTCAINRKYLRELYTLFVFIAFFGAGSILFFDSIVVNLIDQYNINLINGSNEFIASTKANLAGIVLTLIPMFTLVIYKELTSYPPPAKSFERFYNVMVGAFVIGLIGIVCVVGGFSSLSPIGYFQATGPDNSVTKYFTPYFMFVILGFICSVYGIIFATKKSNLGLIFSIFVISSAVVGSPVLFVSGYSANFCYSGYYKTGGTDCPAASALAGALFYMISIVVSLICKFLLGYWASLILLSDKIIVQAT